MNKKVYLLLPFLLFTITGCKTSTKKQDEKGDVTPTVKSVVIEGAPSSSIVVGTSVTLSAKVEVTNSASTVVKWSSSDPTIASVQDGVVTTYKKGLVVISATSIVDSTKKAEVTIVITDAQPDPKEEIKQAFNSLLSSVLTGHNYTISIDSRLIADPEEDPYIDELIMINDKAIFANNDGYGQVGVIYQKDQGYVNFNYINDTVYPTSFYSTNPNIGVSECYDLNGETFARAQFTQSSTDPYKFTTTDADALLVAFNLCGYASSGYASTSTSMEATYDSINQEVVFNYTYWVNYIDPESGDLVNDEGLAVYTLKKVGTTSSTVIESYISNPTKTYVAPTSWSASQQTIWKNYYGNYVPPFLTGASYAFDLETKEMYDGVHLYITDYASGDLTSSYGASLVLEGYQAKSTTLYEKVVIDDIKKTKTTYKVEMIFKDPNEEMYSGGPKFGKYYPKGVFQAEFNETVLPNDVNSVESFNAYITGNGLTDVVPLMPFGAEATAVSFRDATENMEEIYGDKSNPVYRFWSKAAVGSDLMKITIPDASDAIADAQAYIDATKAMGYTIEDKVSTCLTFAKEGGSLIFVTDPSQIKEETYPGYIQIAHRLYTVDDPVVESPLTSIAVSGMTTTFEVGDTFSFDGVCTAYFEDGSSRKVTPTSVSTPDLSSAGTQTITVSYTFNDVTKTATYDITVVAKAQHLITVSTNGHCTIDHFEDEGGNTITSFNYIEGYNVCFIIKMTIDEGYAVTGLTLDGDEGAVGGYDSDTNSFYVYPSKALDSYHVTLTLSVPEVKYTLTKGSYTGCQIKMVSPSTSGSSWQLTAGTEVKFWVKPFSGYQVDSVGIENHPEITFTTEEVDGHTEYSFNMPSFDCKIVATYSSIPVTTTYSITTPTLTGGQIYNVNPGKTDLEAGQQVRFTVKADEGYELVTGSISVKDSNNQDVSFSLAPMSETTYVFTMPASNVTITAQFASTAVTHNVSKQAGEHASITFTSGVQGEDTRYAEVGATVKFSVSVDEGYELDGMPFIVGHEEVTISSSTNMFGKVSYSFTMPDYDVTIGVNTKSTGSSDGDGDGDNDQGAGLYKVLQDAGEIEGTTVSDDTKIFNLTFKSDKTATAVCGNATLQTTYGFDYELTLKSGTTYTVAVSNHKKVSGTMSQSVRPEYITTFEITFNTELTEISSINIVFNNPTYGEYVFAQI